MAGYAAGAGCDDVPMDPDDVEFYRWYGPWSPLTPPQVAELLAGLAAPWWIVGGWAIEAFTGRSRAHEDIDVALFRADLAAVLEHLAPDVCVWSNLNGAVRPLEREDDLPDDCRQLWVRRDGASPWLVDLAMTPHDGNTWISVRDERVRMPLAEAVFEVDGIRYLRPEIVLSFKARPPRSDGDVPFMARVDKPKDDDDFEAALPLLDAESRAALRAAIELYRPGHRWLERIPGPDEGFSARAR